MNIRKTLFAIRVIGLGRTLRTPRYAIYRDRLEKKNSLHWETLSSILPGRLKQVTPVQNGASLQFETTQLEILFLSTDLVRVSWEPGKPPLPYALARVEWPGAEVRITQAEGWVWLRSRSLSVRIGADGSVAFFDENNSILRSELPPTHQIAEVRRKDTAASLVRWTHLSILADEERIYGLGGRAAPLNRRGRAYRMWNSEPGASYQPGFDPLYICIPVYLGLHERGSYLVFYENPFPATFTFENPVPPAIEASRPPDAPAAFSAAQACFEGGMLRYYFIPGPPDRAMARYAELTGRPPQPPRWAFGYHQSRWGYRSEGEIREVIAGFREHQIPISAIHLDIDYMDGYRVFTVAKDRFPDLKTLAEDLDRSGIRLVAIIDPSVKVDQAYGLYREGLEKGYFCTLPDGKLVTGVVMPGWSAFPDFTNPSVRKWWSEQYAFLLESGVSGIWHDMNEPAIFSAWGDLTLPSITRHSLEGRGGDHREAHNLYGLLMNQAGWNGLQKRQPNRRPWILTRSGWAGVQRYAWTWTGDSETSWESLAQTIPMVLGLGLSGLPFSGPDVGGFSGDPTGELYLRWVQMSTFLPFFRTHSAIGTARREPWVYSEPFTSLIREFIRLRYRLLAYLYTLAWETSQTGIPMVRPLFWDNPSDRSLWDVDDSFLLGKSLLVAPILEAGARQRSVRLPDGIWHSFWEDEQYEGNQDVILEAPLERIPLLVRAGTLLPIVDDNRLDLHLYGAKPEVSLLYSDEGDGYGPYRLDEFSLEREGKNLSMTRQHQGEYPFPYSRISVIVHGLEAKRAWVDGQPHPATDHRIDTSLFNSLVIEL